MKYPKTTLLILLVILFFFGNYITIQPTRLENSIMDQGFYPVHRFCHNCRIYVNQDGKITVFSDGHVNFDLQPIQLNIQRYGQILADNYSQEKAIVMLSDFIVIVKGEK